MTEKSIILTYQEFEGIEELNSNDRQLLKEANKASLNAYAPYSRFKVGAAVKCSDGTITIGSNQENAAYPSGLCAERVAIFSAMSQNPNSVIEQVAITIKSHNGNSLEPVAPCGACRQVLAEYEHKQGKRIQIIFSGESGRTIIVKGITNLLPFTFNSDNLAQ